MERDTRRALVAFALIYVTFFLDNVLLTVLVPIIPDWVRGESLELWARHEAPLNALLNATVQRGEESVGGAQATVGAVLSAKAAVQLVSAPLAAAAVCRRGAAPVLRAATALLALAALVFSWCGRWEGRARGVWCACAGRALHGAAGAHACVAGLALCAAAVPRAHAHRAVGALLGAVALGVLVGYPFGGATYSAWSRGAPFQLIAALLLLDLAAQYVYLDRFECEYGSSEVSGEEGGAGAEGREAWSMSAALRVCRSGAVCACAGAVLLTTCVMAALEPSLPLWLARKFHTRRWQAGAAFVPDSAGYLAAATGAGALARAVGAERVALCGQAAVGVGALLVPLAPSVWALALPHVALGAGLGALDAALVPALLQRDPRHAPTLAALLQAASAAAYVIGPVAGGLVSWLCGLETALRALGVLNLLYAALLYRALARHPLSPHWGAPSPARSPAPPPQLAGETTPLR